MGGGAGVGWRSVLQKEVQNAGKPEARRHGRGEHQAACREVLPAEDGALPHGRIPALDEISPDPAVLVVPVPQADETPPLEEVSEVEEGAEDPVGGGLQGDGKGGGSGGKPTSFSQRARAARQCWTSCPRRM